MFLEELKKGSKLGQYQPHPFDNRLDKDFKNACDFYHNFKILIKNNMCELKVGCMKLSYNKGTELSYYPFCNILCRTISPR